MNPSPTCLPRAFRRAFRINATLLAALVMTGVGRPALAGGEDWTAGLHGLVDAVLACAEATPGRPVRVVWAGRAGPREVTVNTRGPQGRRWRCTHGPGGVARVDPDEGATGRVPRGPLFTPAGQPRPDGECYQHEPATTPSGQPLGWISHDTC